MLVWVALSAVLGLAVGTLLIWGATWYEHVAYGRSDSWVAWTLPCASAVIGLAAWAATDTDYSSVGWALALVVAVHAITGTLAAEDQALHNRGREVTATVLKEHVHRHYNDVGKDTGTTYTYDVAVPSGLPRRALDAGATQLAVGARVLATVDPEGRAAPRLGHRPGISQIEVRILRVCDVLFLLITMGLSIGVSFRLAQKYAMAAKQRPQADKREDGAAYAPPRDAVPLADAPLGGRSLR